MSLKDKGNREDSRSGEQLGRRYVSLFTISSIVVILGFGALTAWLVAGAVRLEMIEAYGMAIAPQVNSIAASALSKNDLEEPMDKKRYAVFSDNLKSLSKGTGIKDIKIWRPDGMIVYSSSEDQVGRKLPGSELYRQALRGEPAFNFSGMNQPDEGKPLKEHENVVELYYPLRLGAGDEVDGVFEVHLSTAPIAQEVTQVFEYIAGGFGFLALIVIGFAQISSKMLRNRNNQLVDLTAELKSTADQLGESREEFKSITDTALDAIISMDLSGRILFWNPAAEQIFGYRPDEAIGNNVAMMMPERFREEHRRGVERVAAGQPSKLIGSTIELAGLRRDGTEFPLSLSLSESVGIEGRTFIGLIADITERKEIEEALVASETRFRTLVENSSECICKIDLDGRFEFMSPSGLQSHGIKKVEEVVGKHCTELAEPEFHQLIRETLEKAKRGETVRFQYRCRTPEGVGWFESVLSPQRDIEGRITSLIRLSTDITERKTSEEKLRYLSAHDPLTDLLNRGAFFRRIDEEIERARRYERPFSLLMLDLDHFKMINDEFGHQAGDRVLREVARRVVEAVRVVDITCRYGGEEFMVILPESTMERACEAAHRIRRALAEREIETDRAAVKITTSIGIATFPMDGRNADQLIGRADAALYEAKKAGRNCVVPDRPAA